MSLVVDPYRFGSQFDPLTAIAWRAAWWASDPGWSNPGDGNVVTTWRDGTGNGRDMTGSGSTKPTYRASVAAFNNKPAIDFTAASKTLTLTDSLSGGFSFVVICNHTTVDGSNRYSFGNFSDGWMVGALNTSNWRLYNGMDTAVAPNTSAHMFVGYVNSGSSKLLVDATSASGSIGTSAYTAPAWNPFFGGWLGYAVWGSLIAGDVTANSQWSAFKSWVTATYGITT